MALGLLLIIIHRGIITFRGSKSCFHKLQHGEMVEKLFKKKIQNFKGVTILKVQNRLSSFFKLQNDCSKFELKMPSKWLTYSFTQNVVLCEQKNVNNHVDNSFNTVFTLKKCH